MAQNKIDEKYLKKIEEVQKEENSLVFQIGVIQTRIEDMKSEIESLKSDIQEKKSRIDSLRDKDEQIRKEIRKTYGDVRFDEEGNIIEE